MLLMFVTGVWSLGGMLIRVTFMALERSFSWGRALSVPLGALLLVGAAALSMGAVRPDPIA